MSPSVRAIAGNAGALLALLMLAVVAGYWQAEPMHWPAHAERLGAAGAIVLGYAAVCGLAALRRRTRRSVTAPGDRVALLVAYASQTGYAEQLAWQTTEALRSAGLAVELATLAELDTARLEIYSTALFVVSTSGDGDPPDSAAGFVRRTLAQPAALSGLHYGVLALGDRDYVAFCRFGHTLDGWLRHQGATPLFDPVEVDNADPGALRHWQHHLGLLSGQFEQPDWSPPDYQRWRLAERRLLNPGSLGAPAFLVALEPLDGDWPDWSAGDIAEIGPCNDPAAVAGLLAALQLDAGAGRPLTVQQLLSRSALPHAVDGWEHWRGLTSEALAKRLTPLPHRAYSIASLPTDRRLELLVRQARHADGQLGLGSGWLTEYAQPGAEIALRVRRNTAFHSPAASRPLVLIGNGTGLAGLRAHLKARDLAGETRNWLLFGERSAAHDFFFREEIEGWQQRGLLQRLDLAFSRGQAERLYVQHHLRAAADALRSWVVDGAAIYVCGSLTGMAPAVDAELVDILGAETLEQLAEQGRYRRDVY